MNKHNGNRILLIKIPCMTVPLNTSAKQAEAAFEPSPQRFRGNAIPILPHTHAHARKPD